MPCSGCRGALALTLALALVACGHGRADAPPVEWASIEASEGDPHAYLVAASESLDPGIRGRALGLLIRYDEAPGGGSWAPRALFDPSSYVQRQAVDALEKRLDEEASVDLLETFVRRERIDPYTRGRASVVLALSGHSDERDTLSSAWKAEELHWRRAPLALGALMMGDEEALLGLSEALARGDLPLEIDFFWDLGLSGREELARPLIEGLDLVEETLVLPTAVALISLGHPKGEALFRDALGDKDIELRLEALDYVVELHNEPVARRLLRRARTGGPEAVRRYAELALVARGELEPEPAYEALGNVDRELRQQGVWALAGWLFASPDGSRRERRQAHKLLLASLGDPSPAVVQTAIMGLAKVGRSEDRAVLAALLQEETVGLGVEAAGAMLAINAMEAIGPVGD